MSNLKVPYEISLWEERLVAVDASGNEYDDFIDTSITVDHQYYKEKKICIIGSHTMETPIAAVDPVLVQKVDGTSTLTFSIYSKYYDQTSGELLDNPFVKYLTNERKVKLKYFPKNDNQAEWLDLVIKKISETSESYKFSYTATDSFINELSKTGYNLVFDAELNNNTGSVNDLAAAILEGTDWTVDETAGQLQETIEEPLYELVLNKDITAYKIEDTSQTKSITIKAGSKIYPFYSCVKNSIADFYQFIYLNGADPLIDQDGILRNEGCQYFMKTIPSGTATYFNEYRAERYARTVQIKYEKELERYVQGYKKDGVQKWGYTEDESISPTIVKNYLVNGEDFISTKGWRYNYPGLVETVTHPTIKLAPKAEKRLHLLKTALVPEDKAPDSGPQGLINNGIISNAYEIKNIAAGEKYVFRIKAGSGLNRDTNNPSLTGFDAATKFKFYIGEKTTNDSTGKTTVSNVGALEQGFGIAADRLFDDSSYWTIVTFTKSYNEEELKKLYFSIKPIDGNQYYIEYVQFFPYVEFVDETNTKFICLPNGQVSKAEGGSIEELHNNYVRLKTVYHYYYNDSDNDNKVVPEYKGDKNQDYIPMYVPNYGKVRSITAKESNRFNLLQDLSESFECWCKFTIEHEENGAIKLGDKHKPLKKVSFHAQVGQKKNIGFVYGKNLKSISRTLDSDSIASKLIVKSNANKLAESGSCNIARAAQNPSGENFVYDFSHYIKQGLLNKYNVYNDLYDDNASKGYVGLFPQLKQKNLERDKLIQQSAILAGDYSEYKAQANADELLLEKSRDILFDLETEFVEKTGKSFDALENNDQLLEKDEFLGIATSISLYRQQVEDLEQKINGNSGSKKRLEEIESELRTLSGQLSNIEAETSDLIHKFENKYSRFIQEASWTSEDYIDDNLYYIDAESTLHESAQPKVTYTINVVDLSQLDEYKPYRFELGDITYVQDTDFFGWQLVDGVKTPYKEEIVVTELTTNFHEPDKATIKVRNYKNQFEDLFQRLTASTQQLKFHSGEYDRSADVVNGKGMVQPGALQEAFNNNAYVISNINNQSVEMGEQGIIIRNTRAPNEIVRLASGGIFLTEDGGETWTTGIMASGINAKVITTGTLNAALANITTGNDGGGVFIDENGITGKDSDRNEKFRLSNAGEFKVGNDTNYVKFNENQNGKLDIKADSFSLTSGSVGGPNLLKNTGPIENAGSTTLSEWNRLSDTVLGNVSRVENCKDGKAIVIKTKSSSAYTQATIIQSRTLDENKTYTVSGWYQYQENEYSQLGNSTRKFAIYTYGRESDKNSVYTETIENHELKYFSHTFQPYGADGDDPKIRFGLVRGTNPFVEGETLYLYHLKLEEGPVATAWSENDYDTQARIDITAEGIEQTVSGIRDLALTADYYGKGRDPEIDNGKYKTDCELYYKTILIDPLPNFEDIFSEGKILSVVFPYSNVYVDDTLYLNIGTLSDETSISDGTTKLGYPIYFGGEKTSKSNPFAWSTGAQINFRYFIDADSKPAWEAVDNSGQQIFVSQFKQTADQIAAKVNNVSSGEGCSWALTEKGFYIAQGNKEVTDNTIENYVMKVDENGLIVKGQIEADGGSLNINNNFIVDTSGNVALNGNITWGTGASPTQVVYASYTTSGGVPSKPSDGTEYTRFDLVATTAGQWHRQFNSANDRFGSYTYDGGKTWGEAIVIQGSDGSNGTSTRTLVLDNEFDSLVKTSVGGWISNTSTVNITAYLGSTKQTLSSSKLTVTAPTGWTSGTNYSVSFSSGVGTLNVTNPPANFSGGEFTIQWKNGSTVYATKKFNLQVITSLVDYDLVLDKTSVNNTNASGTIAIKVRKKTRDGTTLLTTVGNEPIKIYNGNTDITSSSWSIAYDTASTNISIALKSSKDETIIWDQQTISFTKDGTSPYTLTLDNEFDSLVKTNAGTWISKTSTVKINGYLGSTWQGLYIKDTPIEVTAPSGWTKGSGTDDNYTVGYSGGVVTLSITNPPNNFTKGEFIIKWKKGDSVVAEKKFNLQVVTSLVDYDLILASTNINNTNTSSVTYIPVKVLKKTKDGTVVLEAKGSEPIDIYKDGTKLTDWEVGYSKDTVNDKVIELKSTDGSIIWDKQTISFVKNGSNGGKGDKGDKGDSGDTIQVKQAFYRSNSATPPSTKPNGSTYPTGWTTTASGVTSSQKYEYISQCTVTNSNYGTWSNAVLFARYGSDGAPGSAATVNAINVFNALTSDGTRFGCFGQEGGALYINANYINTGILRVGDVDSEIFFADINGKSVEIGGWTATETSLKYGGAVGTSGSMHLCPGGSSGTAKFGTMTTASDSWSLTIGSNFGIKNTGVLHATGADIAGKITATSGSIGSWYIDGKRIVSNSKGDTSKKMLYLSSGEDTGFGNWIVAKDSSGNTTFKIAKETGILTANGVDITGKITATGGQIGGLNINKAVTGQRLSYDKILRHSVPNHSSNANVTIANFNSSTAWYNFYYKVEPGKQVTVTPSYSKNVEVHFFDTIPTGNNSYKCYSGHNNAVLSAKEFTIPTGAKYLVVNQEGSVPPTVTFSSTFPLCFIGSDTFSSSTIEYITSTGDTDYDIIPETNYPIDTITAASYTLLKYTSQSPKRIEVSPTTDKKKIHIKFTVTDQTTIARAQIKISFTYTTKSAALFYIDQAGQASFTRLTTENFYCPDIETRLSALESKVFN